MSMLKTLKLKNGLEIPSVAFRIHDFQKEEDYEKVLGHAFKVGYRHFDMSPFFHNLPLISKAIKAFPCERRELTITSKVTP